MQAKSDDLEDLKKVRPYLRSVGAFLLFLRCPENKVETCYACADKFLEQLMQDVKANS